MDKPTALRAVECESPWSDERIESIAAAIQKACLSDDAIVILSVRRTHAVSGVDTVMTSELFKSSRCRVSQAEVLGCAHAMLAQWAMNTAGEP